MPLGLAALDDLFAAFDELRSVLDGTDAAAIEKAASHVSRAVSSVRAIGAWRADPEVVERLRTMAQLIDSARIRVKLLADHAQQRLAILAAHGSQTAPLTYGR